MTLTFIMMGLTPSVNSCSCNGVGTQMEKHIRRSRIIFQVTSGCPVSLVNKVNQYFLAYTSIKVESHAQRK